MLNVMIYSNSAVIDTATTLYAQATPTPSAIKLYMLRLRTATEVPPRRKNGQAAQTTRAGSRGRTESSPIPWAR
jgi:hypothetical protein